MKQGTARHREVDVAIGKPRQIVTVRVAELTRRETARPLDVSAHDVDADSVHAEQLLEPRQLVPAPGPPVKHNVVRLHVQVLLDGHGDALVPVGHVLSPHTAVEAARVGIGTPAVLEVATFQFLFEVNARQVGEVVNVVQPFLVFGFIQLCHKSRIQRCGWSVAVWTRNFMMYIILT